MGKQKLKKENRKTRKQKTKCFSFDNKTSKQIRNENRIEWHRIRIGINIIIVIVIEFDLVIECECEIRINFGADIERSRRDQTQERVAA